MNSTWGWPAVETLHFMGLSLLIGTVGLFDLRMMGLARGIPMSALHKLVPWGVAGYALNVMTGVMFVTSAPDQYLFNPAFQTKLGADGNRRNQRIVLLSIPIRSGQAFRGRCQRTTRSASCGSHFAELLDRRHRVWSFDHLLSPPVPLVFLVLGGLGLPG